MTCGEKKATDERDNEHKTTGKVLEDGRIWRNIVWDPYPHG
jgi:hypothetical protein